MTRSVPLIVLLDFRLFPSKTPSQPGLKPPLISIVSPARSGHIAIPGPFAESSCCLIRIEKVIYLLVRSTLNQKGRPDFFSVDAVVTSITKVRDSLGLGHRLANPTRIGGDDHDANVFSTSVALQKV